MSEPSQDRQQNSIILYTSEDGETRIQLRTEGGTIWLTQLEIAELFQTTKHNISIHTKNIFEERELAREATVKESLTVQTEGGRPVERSITFYNLDLILAIGYRVRSERGTQFRQWATTNLREFMVKGFVMDDERLKNPRTWDYFDNLLTRVREIRASERRFYQKILDVYATSVDYKPDAALAQEFFATVQNKMHFAAHGHTAAEIIERRADSAKPYMGLTSTKVKGLVKKDDIGVAKNYLTAEELDVLNRIAVLFLDFAELQAINRQPMRMDDWVVKLDEFLRISGREALKNAGKISHQAALQKAQSEFEKFRKQQDDLPQKVDEDFEKAAKLVESSGKEKRMAGKQKFK